MTSSTCLVANKTTREYINNTQLYIRGALKRITDQTVLEKSLTSLVQIVARDFIRSCPRVELERIYAFAQDLVNSLVNVERRLADFSPTPGHGPVDADRA